MSRSVILASVALLTILILDFLTPLGVAIGVLYVVCSFLVSRESPTVIITFSVVTAFLALLKFMVFVTADTSYMPYVNRIISVIAIGIICLVSLRYRRLWERLDAQRNSHIKELQEMLFVTSHKIRRPISTCLGLMQLIDSSKSVDQAELHKIIQHLKENALELDTFTKELTKFIYEIQVRNEEQEASPGEKTPEHQRTDRIAS